MDAVPKLADHRKVREGIWERSGRMDDFNRVLE